MNNLELLEPYAEEYNRSVDGIMCRIKSLKEKVYDKLSGVDHILIYSLYDPGMPLGDITMLIDYYEKDVLQIKKIEENDDSRLDIAYSLSYNKFDFRYKNPEAVFGNVAHIPLELLSGNVDIVASNIFKQFLDKRIEILNNRLVSNINDIQKLEDEDKQIEKEINRLTNFKEDDE